MSDLSSLTADQLTEKVQWAMGGLAPREVDAPYLALAELVTRLKTAEDALERSMEAGIERWHEADRLRPAALHEWLGLTWNEYAAWVRGQAPALLAAIRPNPEMSVPCQEPERSGLVDGA